MGVYSAVKSLFTKKQIDAITQNVTDKTEYDEILQIISKWKGSQSQSVITAITTDGERNYSYYLGKYPRDLYALKYGKSQIIVNHIFASIKSVTPYVTSKPAEPVVYPRKYNIEQEKTEEAYEKLENVDTICDFQKSRLYKHIKFQDAENPYAEEMKKDWSKIKSNLKYGRR